MVPRTEAPRTPHYAGDQPLGFLDRLPRSGPWVIPRFPAGRLLKRTGETVRDIKTFVSQITISDDTYAKLLRVGEITQQDPHAWADAILARLAADVIKTEGSRAIRIPRPDRASYRNLNELSECGSPAD